MAVAVASLTASAITVDNQAPISVKAIRAMASETSVVELPAKAAEIVSAASEETREKVAIRTVRIFLQNHHSLAPSLVGAIAHAAPEVAAAVTAEAIRLFPESAYSITKAAVSAAPKHAVQIALRAGAADRARSAEITAAVQRAIPEHAEAYLNVLSALVKGERVETVDLAVVTVKIRIGSSTDNRPASETNLSLNNVIGQQQQTFVGTNQRIETDPDTGEQFVIVEVDLGATVEVPEDLTGQDKNDFDVLVRQLFNDNKNPFVNNVTIQAYVN